MAPTQNSWKLLDEGSLSNHLGARKVGGFASKPLAHFGVQGFRFQGCRI